MRSTTDIIVGAHPSEASHLRDLILILALFHMCQAPMVFTKISPFQSSLGQEDLGEDLPAVVPFLRSILVSSTLI